MNENMNKQIEFMEQLKAQPDDIRQIMTIQSLIRIETLLKEQYNNNNMYYLNLAIVIQVVSVLIYLGVK